MIPAKYAKLCPACGNDVSVAELEKGICAELSTELSKPKPELKEFESFFNKAFGSLRELQKFWAKRLLSNESFAAVAPTGIGKSTFGITYASWLATKGKKSYLLFPTTLLVEQAKSVIEKIEQSHGIKVNAIFYIKGTKKEEFLEKVQKGEFSIVATTTQFLAKNFDAFSSLTFDFIFVDDVDAILKASRNVHRLLQLLGFKFTSGSWKGSAKGTLMVSTATAKPGKNTRLFRELLNFDVGSSYFTIRNIEDIIAGEESKEKLAELLQAMGRGAFIYAKSSELAKKLYNELKSRFKIGIVSAKSKQAFEEFKQAKLDYLIGTASYYGTLVRGLDLPREVRYAVFIGVPSFRVTLADIDELSPNMIKLIASLLREDERIKPFVPLLAVIEKRKELAKLKEVLKEVLSEGKTNAKDFVLRKNELLVPDVRTYLQASGRTSRLLESGITKGASFIFESDAELLQAFIERASYYDVEFKELSEVDLEKLKQEIDSSRRRSEEKLKDIIKPALFIVESPTKAKLIARFFGRPSIKILEGAVAYEVASEKYIILITASLGHVTDLITNRAFHGVETNGKFVPIYASIKRCLKCNYQFTEESNKCPRCGSEEISDAKQRIEALRKLASDAGFVIIGTDPDAEGEKIAWDLANLLKPYAKVARAEFHEVTPKALKQALSELREIDENLVKAQIVRRIEDRWIGFTLSQKLWRVFNRHNLSAGRAQTPVLGWIIEQAKEHAKKKVLASVPELGLVLEGISNKELELEIELIEERKELIKPAPPYTTDEMLKDASRILKLSAKQAMQIAQHLFESGLITYHRTDSTNVSDAGMRIAKQYLGDDFKARSWKAEGAHECIRPTRPLDKQMLARLIYEKVLNVEGITKQHLALYDLIFRRFIASQCKEFEAKLHKYRIFCDGKEFIEERIVEAKGRAIELYRNVQIKSKLPLGKLKVEAKVLKVPKVPLFTQADVIRLMKERSIGRPSTYATLLEKLFMRRYIIERSQRLLPTKLGKEVFAFLSENYGEFISEERTKELLQKMDEIESGKASYEATLREIYEEIRRIE